MKGMVRHFLLATMAVFLITTGISFALVGDVDESDLYMQSDQGLSGTASENSVGRSASIEETGPVGAYIPYQGSSSTQAPYQKGYAEGFAELSESSSVPVTSSGPGHIFNPVLCSDRFRSGNSGWLQLQRISTPVGRDQVEGLFLRIRMVSEDVHPTGQIVGLVSSGM